MGRRERMNAVVAIGFAVFVSSVLGQKTVCSNDASNFLQAGITKICFPIRNENRRIGDYCVLTEMMDSKMCVKGYFEVNVGFTFKGIKFGVHPDCDGEITDGPQRYSQEVVFEGDGVESSEQFVCLDEIRGKWPGRFGCCNQFLCTTAEVMMMDESGDVGTYYPGIAGRCSEGPTFQCPVELECAGKIPSQAARERGETTLKTMEVAANSLMTALESLEEEFQLEGSAVREILRRGSRLERKVAPKLPSRFFSEDSRDAITVIADVEAFLEMYKNQRELAGAGTCNAATGVSFGFNFRGLQEDLRVPPQDYIIVTWILSFSPSALERCSEWELRPNNLAKLITLFEATTGLPGDPFPMREYVGADSTFIKELQIIPDYENDPTLKVEFYVFDRTGGFPGNFDYDADTMESDYKFKLFNLRAIVEPEFQFSFQEFVISFTGSVERPLAVEPIPTRPELAQIVFNQIQFL